MKFAYIHNIRIPSEKAHSLYIVKVCQATKKLGFGVSLIASKHQNNSTSGSIWDYYNINSKLFTYTELEIGNKWRGKIWKLSPNHGQSTLNVIFCFKAWDWLRRNRIDIVQTGHYEFLLIVKIFGWIYRPKIILDIHIDPPRWITSGWYRDVSCVICNTQYFANQIKGKIDNKKAIVLPNGFDPNDFSGKYMERKTLSIPENAIVIGYIGSFEFNGQEKGINLLIRTIHECRKTNKNIYGLIIGGPKHMADDYRRLVDSLQLSKFIIIIDQVRPELIPEYLSLMSLAWAVYPESKYLKHKTSPMKLIEYMAAGKPVFASNYPSITQVINSERGYLIDNQDPKIMAGLINRTSSLELKQKGDRGKQFVQQFTWEDRQRRAMELLENSTRQKIIAIMRIKNQILTISKCLDKLSEIVDEIVIVDNGSTDGTKNEYAKYPKIVDITYTTGFDEGRDKNLALEHARRRHPDWIIWLDGDEIFEKSTTRADIEKYLLMPNVGLIQFRMFNFYMSTKSHRVDGIWRKYATNPQKRLWKDCPQAHFNNRKFHAGAVAETVGEVVTAKERLMHFGYINKQQIEIKDNLYASLSEDEMSKKTIKMNSKSTKTIPWLESNNQFINSMIQKIENTIWTCAGYYDYICMKLLRKSK